MGESGLVMFKIYRPDEDKPMMLLMPSSLFLDLLPALFALMDWMHVWGVELRGADTMKEVLSRFDSIEDPEYTAMVYHNGEWRPFVGAEMM